MELVRDEKHKKQINAFTLMMTNRHKQDEIIKNLEQVKESPVCEDDCNSDTEIIDSPEMELLTTKCSGASVNDTKQIKCSKLNVDYLSDNSTRPRPISTLNAFQYLMSRPICLKNIFSDDDLETSFESDCNKNKNNLSPQKQQILHKNIIENTPTINLSSDGSCDSQDANEFNLNSSQHQSLNKLQRNEILDHVIGSNLPSENELSKSHYDMKLNLINENEYFNIEETFKAEILECVLKKKKRKKRKTKLKNNNNNNNVNKSEDSGISVSVPVRQQGNELESRFQNGGGGHNYDDDDIDHNDDDNDDLVTEKENLVTNVNYKTKVTSHLETSDTSRSYLQRHSSQSQQPDIKSFFRSLAKNKDKVSSKDKNLDINNENESKMADQLNARHNSKQLEGKLLGKINGPTLLDNEVYGCFVQSSTPKVSSAKLKAKMLRNIRIKHKPSHNHHLPDITSKDKLFPSILYQNKSTDDLEVDILSLNNNKSQNCLENDSLLPDESRFQTDLETDALVLYKDQSIDRVNGEQTSQLAKPNFSSFFSLIPKEKDAETTNFENYSPTDLGLDMSIFSGKSTACSENIKETSQEKVFSTDMELNKNSKEERIALFVTNKNQNIENLPGTAFEEGMNDQNSRNNNSATCEISSNINPNYAISSTKVCQSKKGLKRNNLINKPSSLNKNSLGKTKADSGSQSVKNNILTFFSLACGQKHSETSDSQSNSDSEVSSYFESCHEKPSTNQINEYQKDFVSIGGAFTGNRPIRNSKKKSVLASPAVVDNKNQVEKSLAKNRGLRLKTKSLPEVQNGYNQNNVSSEFSSKLSENIKNEICKSHRMNQSFDKSQAGVQTLNRNILKFFSVADEENETRTINSPTNSDSDLDIKTIDTKTAMPNVHASKQTVLNEKSKNVLDNLISTAEKKKQETEKMPVRRNFRSVMSVEDKKYFGIFTGDCQIGKTNKNSVINSDSDCEVVSENSAVPNVCEPVEEPEFSDEIKTKDNLVLTDKEGSSVENKLRRSCRAVKKTKLFETPEFHKKKHGKVFHSKNNMSGDLELVTIKKSSCQERKNILDKDMSSSLKSLSLKHRKQNSRMGDKGSSLSRPVSVNKDPPHSQVSSSENDTDIEVPVNSSSKNADEKKMAPIFVKKKTVVISPTKLKARAEFLFSDVPESLKKLSVKSDEQNYSCPFPKYSHIQQNSKDCDTFWNLQDPDVFPWYKGLEEITCCTPQEPFCGMTSNPSLNQAEDLLPNSPRQFPPLSALTVCQILAYLKAKNQDFPTFSVYSAYIASREDHLNIYKQKCAREALRKISQNCSETNLNEISQQTEESMSLLLLKKGQKKRKKKLKCLQSIKRRKLSATETTKSPEIRDEDIPIWDKWIPYEWTQVFAPRSADFVIGNKESIRDMKDILSDWKTVGKTESPASGSNMSDDSTNSGTEENFLNSILITGPPGIGKTSLVYAIAQDFSYKVLEVNASSSRQGKQLLSQLSEATQSHSLSSSNSSQIIGASLEHSQVEGWDQSEKSKSMSLILIEDIDIVFEETDDGFWLAVNTLLSTSKRPIIMTSSLNSTSFMKKIKGNYKRIDFTLPDPHRIAQHLQLMCLANGVFASLKEIELLVKCNKEDIRKSVSDLQVWVMSGVCDVQWWKLNNSKNMSNALKLNNKREPSIQTLFPCAGRVSSKSVELPISLGCLWNKRDAQLLNEQYPKLESDAPLNWVFLSSNSTSLFPFVRRQRKRERKYPLKSDDPDLKNATLWLKYTWLEINDESDPEDQISTCDNDRKEKKLPTPSAEMKRACTICLNSLSGYLNAVADFDVFSFGSMLSESKECCDEFRNKFWTPSILPGLESVSNKASFYSYSTNFSLNLIPELSKLTLKCTENEFLKVASSVDVNDAYSPLCVDVQEEIPAHIMKPHSLRSRREVLRSEDLNQTLTSLLPCLSQMCRSAIVNDYLPYLREIARIDHLGESVKKHFKRNRRYSKYLGQIGYDVSPRKLIDMCNVFHNL